MVGIPPPKKSGLKSMAMKAKLEHKDQCKTEKARLKAEKVSRTAATKKTREVKTDAKFQKKKKVEPEGTVFTEEDFEKFSKEYFVNSKPVNSTTLVSKPRFDE